MLFYSIWCTLHHLIYVVYYAIQYYVHIFNKSSHFMYIVICTCRIDRIGNWKLCTCTLHLLCIYVILFYVHIFAYEIQHHKLSHFIPYHSNSYYNFKYYSNCLPIDIFVVIQFYVHFFSSFHFIYRYFVYKMGWNVHDQKYIF